MEPARPLRDIFDELARGDHGADPAETLADGGHGDLPDQLVSEAIVSYADTAPVEVAEHLAPFVKVHSAVPAADEGEPAGESASDGLELLATAPEPILADGEPVEPEPTPADPAETEPALAGADALDFGFGSGAAELSGAAEGTAGDSELSIADETEPVAPVAAEEPPLTEAELADSWLATPAVDDREAPAEDDGEDGEPVG
ncbi:MAG TPA: hypothetical protein VIL37_00020 [Natronosporangium sp.]